MSKQTISLGTPPSGVGGDTPRSAFTKAQNNFDELYARQEQLGTASNRNVGTVAGQVMEVGAFGLGTNFNLPSSADMNNGPAVYATGMYKYAATTVGRPDFGSGYGSFLQFSTVSDAGGGYGAQIAFDYLQADAGFRAFRGGSGPSAWCKLYHTGNTTRAADGTLKAI